MIDVEELRLGNLIQDEWGGLIEFDSIGKDGVELRMEDDGNYPECAKRWIEAEYKQDELFRIPLTEEWLVRFGFKYNPFSLLYEKESVWGEFCDGFCIIINNTEYIITTVHQLQNLYFVLTGEELIWKQ